MKKTLTAALAALTFGGAIAATAAPAQARPHGSYGGYHGGGYYGGYHHDNNAGVAVAAGIVGLALGAALTSNSRPYYNSGYNSGAYYSSGPYYDSGYAYAPPPAYRTCVSSRWVWDAYRRENVLVRSSYAC